MSTELDSTEPDVVQTNADGAARNGKDAPPTVEAQAESHKAIKLAAATAVAGQVSSPPDDELAPLVPKVQQLFDAWAQQQRPEAAE